MFQDVKIRAVFACAFVFSAIVAFLCGGLVVKAQEPVPPLHDSIEGTVITVTAPTSDPVIQPSTPAQPDVVTQNPIVEFFKKMPGMRPGVMYNYKDSDVSFLYTAILAEKGIFAIEGGYSTSDDLVGVISFKLVALKDLGIDLPILDLIEFRPGYAVGTSRIGSGGGNCEFVHGATATIINIKW